MHRLIQQTIVTVLGIAAATLSCAQTQPPTSQQDQAARTARIQAALAATLAPPDTLIILQRDGCEGPCPVYRLVLFADGTVLYQGQYHVRRTGFAKGGIAPEALIKLVADIDASGFFQLDNNYGDGNTEHCDAVDNGRPRVIITVSSQGRAKTVLHHHRCRGAIPDRITALEDRIDQAAGTALWIK